MVLVKIAPSQLQYLMQITQLALVVKEFMILIFVAVWHIIGPIQMLQKLLELSLQMIHLLYTALQILHFITPQVKLVSNVHQVLLYIMFLVDCA